jgi:hypothetical protein
VAQVKAVAGAIHSRDNARFPDWDENIGVNKLVQELTTSRRISDPAQRVLSSRFQFAAYRSNQPRIDPSRKVHNHVLR